MHIDYHNIRLICIYNLVLSELLLYFKDYAYQTLSVCK